MVVFYYEFGYWLYEMKDFMMLGEVQWAWLGKVLEKLVDLWVIVSSMQFGIIYNGYEVWANFLYEQECMLEFIKVKKVNGVVFIFGDVYYVEVFKVFYLGLYLIYDVILSGIIFIWGFVIFNDNCIQGLVMENYFGLLEMDWGKEELCMKVIDVVGQECFVEMVSYDELKSW